MSRPIWNLLGGGVVVLTQALSATPSYAVGAEPNVAIHSGATGLDAPGPVGVECASAT